MEDDLEFGDATAMTDATGIDSLQMLDPDGYIDNILFESLKQCVVTVDKAQCKDYVEALMMYVAASDDSKNIDLDMEAQLKRGKAVGGPCRKHITSSDKFAYRCIDCSKKDNTLLCIACFEHGKHKDHRYYRMTEMLARHDDGRLRLRRLQHVGTQRQLL